MKKNILLSGLVALWPNIPYIPYERYPIGQRHGIYAKQPQTSKHEI